MILQRIREAERDAIYQRYQSRVGEIVHCSVRSVEYSAGIITCTIDGKAEGGLNKEDQIPTERYRVGSKIRCYLVDVERGNRGPAIRLCAPIAGYCAAFWNRKCRRFSTAA